ncbi:MULTISPECIES: hypothetical protein [Photorhabdus]|uniref:hypothetical protein n=1 Tax=Photorhabdus TaxID=29487 RepID=UPI0011C41C97|nr:hypothetical protein [Photorhabdus asymbiotica]
MTGVSECNQQRGDLKDEGYNNIFIESSSRINCIYLLAKIKDDVHISLKWLFLVRVKAGLN